MNGNYSSLLERVASYGSKARLKWLSVCMCVGLASARQIAVFTKEKERKINVYMKQQRAKTQ